MDAPAPRYIIKCDKVNGRYTTRYPFWSRERAIVFLNTLIIDLAVSDARLTVTRKPRTPKG